MNIEERLVWRLADRATEKIVRRIIRQLQAEATASTGQEHLQTAWDDICIQVQVDESYYWDAYIEEIDRRIEWEFNELPEIERTAIWLQSDEGSRWSVDSGESDEKPPIFAADVLNDVRAEVLGKAGDWTNSAIRAQKSADEEGRYSMNEDREWLLGHGNTD
jgi:hypothetical protein